MPLSNALARRRSNTVLLICLTLLTGGLFKISAFAREAFIAAKFGLSSTTDAYFALQQLPLTAATFMFGSFALAFTPMYADARRRCGDVSWMPGLTFYALLIGSILTFGMVLAAPLLLKVFVRSNEPETWSTLAILSVCFCPVICIGIWAGICTARGENLWAMSMTGLPYLVMTLVLLTLYAAGSLNGLSLPISMSAGFGLVGAYALFRILRSHSMPIASLKSVISVWRIPDFRRFLTQLVASSLENFGFAANQLLILYFLAGAGSGRISANNCAMRIGMLGYGLLAQPLAQLVQARFCESASHLRADLFRRWLLTVAAAVLLFAVAMYTFRETVIRIVYMHGKFRGGELDEVTAILPAWIGYFVVMSLNAIVARYRFTGLKGATYVRSMLCAYTAANVLRFLFASEMTVSSIIWCSVFTEGCALGINLRSCFIETESRKMVPAFAATS